MLWNRVFDERGLLLHLYRLKGLLLMELVFCYCSKQTSSYDYELCFLSLGFHDDKKEDYF